MLTAVLFRSPRFIKKTLKTNKHDLVCLDKNKEPMSLEKVFQSMNISSYGK